MILLCALERLVKKTLDFGSPFICGWLDGRTKDLLKKQQELGLKQDKIEKSRWIRFSQKGVSIERADNPSILVVAHVMQLTFLYLCNRQLTLTGTFESTNKFGGECRASFEKIFSIHNEHAAPLIFHFQHQVFKVIRRIRIASIIPLSELSQADDAQNCWCLYYKPIAKQSRNSFTTKLAYCRRVAIWPIGWGHQWLLSSPPIRRNCIWLNGRFGEARQAGMGRTFTLIEVKELNYRTAGMEKRQNSNVFISRR